MLEKFWILSVNLRISIPWNGFIRNYGFLCEKDYICVLEKDNIQFFVEPYNLGQNFNNIWRSK